MPARGEKESCGGEKIYSHLHVGIDLSRAAHVDHSNQPQAALL